MARRRSMRRLNPQIRANEEGARVTSSAAAASLPDNDDMLREILLRLPPQPSSLHRASAVCKRWRGLIKDPKFQRQFRGHHRKPPLLGIFTYSSQGILFTPILHPPDRIPPRRFDLGLCSNHAYYDFLDCRHGLVLVKKTLPGDVIVCDPITGEQRCVVVPAELKMGYLKGSVLCAAGDHGSGESSPFR
ncbi:hypothetical protein QYE76_049365 [Lolium multiflorum]|uniref:F-box domain-containing protein n=1 Tax=Lolium multiflorum TaxID=4521 RepID=A0AAD8SPU4_LOLMU|nr:hypothetical protein QYE76_049365 [Lolium multiflorum]